MDGIEEIGKKAYQKQMWGAYEEAITLYSDAIKRHSNDARLLNNRCMCYLELKDYKRAMDDAENMILLFPQNKKSYFRKGEVLMNMEKYSQAEEAFKLVLKLEPRCEEAIRHILEVQTLELSKQTKYTKKNIIRALRMTNDVEQAEKLLKSGKFNAIMQELDEAVYYSEEEDDKSENEYDVFLDPSNPLGSTSLWVGNLTKEVTEQTLKNLFGKYGRLKSLKSNGQYAFINYFDAVGPAKAMKNLQGTIVGSKNIIIKFPDSSKKSVKPK
ncbi:Protein split ends [Gryllus bimaculatus]|nr:Protein split ends [Gryllus bimaculatus]